MDTLKRDKRMKINVAPEFCTALWGHLKLDPHKVKKEVEIFSDNERDLLVTLTVRLNTEDLSAITDKIRFFKQ